MEQKKRSGKGILLVRNLTVLPFLYRTAPAKATNHARRHPDRSHASVEYDRRIDRLLWLSVGKGFPSPARQLTWGLIQAKIYHLQPTTKWRLFLCSDMDVNSLLRREGCSLAQVERYDVFLNWSTWLLPLMLFNPEFAKSIGSRRVRSFNPIASSSFLVH